MVTQLASPLVVALDVPTLDQAEALARMLTDHVGCLKIGLELYTAYGPEAVRRLEPHAPLFLDIKLHDIPTTVERACARVADLGVSMVTVHASGGPSMLEAAARGIGRSADTRVLAVTVLTSLTNAELAAVGQPPADEQVPRLARMAIDAGADGLVCAAPDLERVRAEVGAKPLVATPGIRPTGANMHDQARVASPAQALAAGADLLIVGRPVTNSDDPLAAAVAILAELESS